MGFGKRVPKRKTSCCTSCTSPHEGKDNAPKRATKLRKMHEDEEESYGESTKSKRDKRKMCVKNDEELSVLPTEWLNDTSVLESMNMLEKPESDIFQILESHLTSCIPLNEVEASDLLSLVGSNCISLGVIGKIENLLNRESLSSFCFHFNHFLSDEKGTTQLIQNRYPMNQLLMYLDIDKDDKGETYLAEPGDINDSHFTLAVFDFESLTLLYADTLGWNIPITFVNKLEELLSSLGCSVVFHTVLCHPPNDPEYHICDLDCSPLYPFQTCDNVSGIAVIICMVIAFLQYDIFLSLAMGIHSTENMYFHYLQDISDHSKFLRLVIGSWIVNDFVNFNNIACCDELMKYQDCGLTQSKFGKEISNSSLHNSKKSHFDNNVNIKVEPDLEMANLPEPRLISSYILDEFISSRPVVHFCKPNHFRLKLTLKDGRSLYKMFKCAGKSDNASMRVITEFLNGYKVIDWIKSKTFKNASVVSNTRLRKNKTCNILDFPDDIQEYFIKNPELSFEKKIRYLVLRVYVKGCSSVMTKKFQCSAAGKNDSSAIKRINTYVSSKEFRDLVVNNANTECKLSDEKLNYANFDELVIRKPLIHHIKERSILKVECQLRTGKRVYRGFACSSAGKGDLKAMAAIKRFLGTKEAAEWIRSKYESKLEKKKKNQKQKITLKTQKDDVWISSGELSVGFEVKNFFDAIEFDFRKRVVMAKGVTTLYEGNAIITENEKWGKTHRFDETYILNEAAVTEKGVFPAVTMYVTCSSKSSECKAQCGTPLKDLANTAIGNECPGCRAVLEFPCKECMNCSASSTPKWYSINNELYCSACYQYQQKHNESRPSELKLKSAQAVSRLYHPHFVCGWKLKLVIYSNNLSSWKVFKHKENINFHSGQTEEIDKKPNISVLPTSTVLVSKSPPKCQKVIIKNRNILCSHCISENASAPFVCTSQTQLMKHVSIAHKISFINCATCWSESGSLVNFENEHQLQQHIQECHKGDDRFPSDIDHERDQDPIETTRQVELDEAVIALLEPSPM